MRRSMPTNLESKAAYVAHRLKSYRVSAARVLSAMLEWNDMTPDQKAKYRLPPDDRWTADELDTLRLLYKNDALPEEILEALPERSYSAITHKAHREGILRSSEYRSETNKKARACNMTRPVKRP